MLLQLLSLASSADVREDEIPPVGSSHVIPQLSDSPPATFPLEERTQENLDAVVSPRRSIFTKWLQRMGNKGPPSQKPDRPSETSRQPAVRRSPFRSPARVDDSYAGPSRMAAAQPTPVSAFP